MPRNFTRYAEPASATGIGPSRSQLPKPEYSLSVINQLPSAYKTHVKRCSNRAVFYPQQL